MYHTPCVSVIIPCLNGHLYLSNLLDHLEKQTHPVFEVIVIDNGSSPPLQQNRGTSPTQFSLKYLRYEFNRGYAAAVNAGIAESRYPFIMVLNADMTLPGNFFSKLMPYLTDALANQQVYSFPVWHENLNLQSTGIHLTSFLRARESTACDPVDGPQGAAFLIHRNLILKANCHCGSLFDENYFFLWEDVELSLRLKRASIRTYVIPDIVLTHRGNSSNLKQCKRQALSYRNRLLLIHQHFPQYLLKKFHIFLSYDCPRFVWLMLINPHRKTLLNWTWAFVKDFFASANKKGGFTPPFDLLLLPDEITSFPSQE